MEEAAPLLRSKPLTRGCAYVVVEPAVGCAPKIRLVVGRSVEGEDPAVVRGGGAYVVERAAGDALKIRLEAGRSTEGV